MSIKIEHVSHLYGEGEAFEKKALDDVTPVSYTHLFIFCHPENLASRRTAEKLCHLYPEHFQLVLEEL